VDTASVVLEKRSGFNLSYFYPDGTVQIDLRPGTEVTVDVVGYVTA
jgi:hypothetical protein